MTPPIGGYARTGFRLALGLASLPMVDMLATSTGFAVLGLESRIEPNDSQLDLLCEADGLRVGLYCSRLRSFCGLSVEADEPRFFISMTY